MECGLCATAFAFIVLLICIKLFKSFLFPKQYVRGLSSKYVFITGCDTGFGRATAIRLDQLGVNVFAACLSEQGAVNLKRECSERVKTPILDVTKSENIQAVYEAVKRELPPDTGLWGLVNNAGILDISPIEWVPLNVYKRLADVNLWGLIDVTKTFLPLVKHARGRVVNMSSIGGCFSFGCYAPYSVTKYGVEAFSDALRREMHPWGVGVSIIEPSGFQTNIVTDNPPLKTIGRHWDELSEELKESYGGEYFKALLTSLDPKHYQINKDLSEVVDVIAEGLLSNSPRARYLVGAPARYLFIWLKHLPDDIGDWLQRWMIKMTGADLTPKACKSPPA